MGIISNEVKIKWNPANRKHFEDLGYKFTKYNEFITVNIEHLNKSSKIEVLCECDYCGENFNRQFARVNTSANNDKVCCKKCHNKKT